LLLHGDHHPRPAENTEQYSWLAIGSKPRSDANCQAVPSPSALVASVTPGHIEEDAKGSYNWCCILAQRAPCFNTPATLCTQSAALPTISLDSHSPVVQLSYGTAYLQILYQGGYDLNQVI